MSDCSGIVDGTVNGTVVYSVSVTNTILVGKSGLVVAVAIAVWFSKIPDIAGPEEIGNDVGTNVVELEPCRCFVPELVLTVGSS